MKTRRFLVLLALAVASAGVAAAADEQPAAGGRGLYMRHCAPCHGQSGKGDGPNAELFLSKPRDLTDGVLDQYTTDALVKRVLDGSRLPLGLDVAALRRHSDEVGAIERHVRKFPQLDWVAVENGWAIFAERCAVCHGPFGEPRAALPDGVKAPGNLQSEAFQSSVTDAQLMKAVRHGRKGMPALVPRLREDEAANVAAFVRVLSPGFQSYSMFCGQCHGDDGVGVGNI